MPFLIPLIPLIAGVATAGAGVAGAVEGAQAGGRQQKALSIQEQIAQQEQADKQKIFDQLVPFFSSYLSSGSPFLNQIQRAGAEQNATQFNNAAGQLRSQMNTSGFGFGPSGTTAAALGGLGAESARGSTDTFLQNLLANEQIKFQAAQGLQGAGSMAGSPQNQPNVSVQLQPQTLGSSIYGLGQTLNQIPKTTAPTNPQTQPYPLPPGGNIPSPFPFSTTGGTAP